MGATMEQIIESNRIKEEACNRCIEDLEGILTEEQLEHFKNAFMDAANGYIFSKKCD